MISPDDTGDQRAANMGNTAIMGAQSLGGALSRLIPGGQLAGAAPAMIGHTLQNMSANKMHDKNNLDLYRLDQQK